MLYPNQHNKQHSKYKHFYLLIQFSGSCNQNDKSWLAITSHLHNGKGGHYTIQGRKICPRNASHLPIFILHLQKCNSLWSWAFPCRSIKVANCAIVNMPFPHLGIWRLEFLSAQVDAFVCITTGRKKYVVGKCINECWKKVYTQELSHMEKAFSNEVKYKLVNSKSLDLEFFKNCNLFLIKVRYRDWSKKKSVIFVQSS